MPLDSLGKWPITVGRTRTSHAVYLSEESHFDVVLGRSFVERRQIRFDPVDPTDVVCQDTGEKIDCELVILKDGTDLFAGWAPRCSIKAAGPVTFPVDEFAEAPLQGTVLDPATGSPFTWYSDTFTV